MNRRLFALLEWDEQIGAATQVVGVLGIEPGHAPFVEWVPGDIEACARWYWRLEQGVEPARLESWLEENATIGLAEEDDPGPGIDLRTAVAAVLDARLGAPLLADVEEA